LASFAYSESLKAGRGAAPRSGQLALITALLGFAVGYGVSYNACRMLKRKVDDFRSSLAKSSSYKAPQTFGELKLELDRLLRLYRNEVTYDPKLMA